MSQSLRTLLRQEEEEVPLTSGWGSLSVPFRPSADSTRPMRTKESNLSQYKYSNVKLFQSDVCPDVQMLHNSAKFTFQINHPTKKGSLEKELCTLRSRSRECMSHAKERLF